MLLLQQNHKTPADATTITHTVNYYYYYYYWKFQPIYLFHKSKKSNSSSNKNDDTNNSNSYSGSRMVLLGAFIFPHGAITLRPEYFQEKELLLLSRPKNSIAETETAKIVEECRDLNLAMSRAADEIVALNPDLIFLMYAIITITIITSIFLICCCCCFEQ